LQEIEALLHDAPARVQTATDESQERAAIILRDADALNSPRHKEAEELVAEAMARTASILITARDQEAVLRQELDRLAERRLRMLDDVRATVDACHEWLATVDPRHRGAEDRNPSSEPVAMDIGSTDDSIQCDELKR
jgi:hypothetical protein